MKTLFRIIVIGFLLLPTMLVAQNKKIASPLLAGKHVNKKIISTEKAPGAIGPYSQGITAGGFLFTSGQLPVNPKTGEVTSVKVYAYGSHYKILLFLYDSGMKDT